MKNNIDKLILMRCMRLLHFIVTIALFSVCWYSFYIIRYGAESFIYSVTLASGLYIILSICLIRIYNGFAVGIYRVWELIYSQSLGNLITASFMYAVASIAWNRLVNPFPLLILLGCQVSFNALWSIKANNLFFTLYAKRKAAVIYEDDIELQSIEKIHYFSQHFSIEKYIRHPESVEETIRAMDGLGIIFVAAKNIPFRNEIIKYCVQNNVQAYVAPQIEDVFIAGAKQLQMFNMPMIRIRRAEPLIEYVFLKRMLDILFSIVAIVITCPIMAVLALTIKTYDRGPVIYKQQRLTKGRKTFAILKFRSMRTDAEKDGVARLASENDDRITPIGKVIRRIRLDELPQLFNILAGDMSFVGPRPERPEIVEQLEKELPEFSLRLQVKAGLTGFAQVYGRYNTEPNWKLHMDIIYINNMSLIEDLKLIVATVKIIFMKESTSGVKDGQTVASKVDVAVKKGKNA